MSTMNISLPDSLKSFVDEQVAKGGYGTSSEYVRELIRNEQDRQRLRDLLLAGATSPPAGPADVPLPEYRRGEGRAGFIEALEQAYAHIGRHRNAIAAGHPHFHLGGHGQQKTEAPCAPGQSSRRM